MAGIGRSGAGSGGRGSSGALARLGLIGALLVLLGVLASPPVAAQEPTPPPAGTEAPAPQSEIPTVAPTASPTSPPTPTPLPQPTRTSNALEGTVSAVSPEASTITLEVDRQLTTLEIPAEVPVIRDGRPASLDVIEATDRITIQRNSAGRVLGVLAFGVPRTPAPTAAPTAAVTPTSEPVPEISPTAVGTPGPRVVSGSVTANADGVLTVVTDTGETQQIVAASVPGLLVSRDGQSVGLGGVQVADDVRIMYNARNLPQTVVATGTTESIPPPPSPWTSLLYLAPLLALLLVPLLLTIGGRRPAGRFFMTARRGR